MNLHGYFSEDTIAAIATSMGTDAGVGIIRVSGKNCEKIYQQLTRKPSLPKARFATRVELYDDVDLLDDGLVLFFEEGSSFTGESVLEFQLHGGRYILSKILKKLISTGLCRLAGPGEFSFRAVKNNKLKLDQADGINQLIKAKNHYEAWSARQNISGARRAQFKELQSELHQLLAQVELSIDFIEQDVEVLPLNEFSRKLNQIAHKVDNILSIVKLSQRVAQGPLIVFYGKPNVGKSTLFNAILGEDRAIVSDQPGTTRDVITESLEIGKYTARIADTAGIRSADDNIEAEGVLRTKKQIDHGDIKVLLLCEEPTEEERSVEPDLVVLTKSKTRKPEDNENLLKKISYVYASSRTTLLSAYENEGLDVFLQILSELLDDKFASGVYAPLPSEYQLQVLTELKATLSEAKEAFSRSGTDEPEILSSILFRSAGALTEVCGETNPDTILNKIFSEFCIGK